MKVSVNSLSTILYAIFICCSVAMFSTSSYAQQSLSISTADPLQNIFPGISTPIANLDTIRVARGENAVAQLIVSSSGTVNQLSATLKSLKNDRGDQLCQWNAGWVHSVKSTHNYAPASPDALFSPLGIYPDPILTDTTIEIGEKEKGILYLDITIPTDVSPGYYEGIVEVNGLSGNQAIAATQKIMIEVYPVTLPSQSLFVTNWYFPDKFTHMNNGNDVDDNSTVYWECMKELIGTASNYGQNVWLLYETGIPIWSDPAGNPQFDFTRMDKSILFLLQNANVELIEANHIAKRSHNKWTDPFWAEIPVRKNDSLTETIRLPYDDPRTEKYLSAYFYALQEHLRSKKLDDGSGRSWLDIYVQHVADEPLNENKESWEGLARIIKKVAPEIKIIEAYRSTTYDPELIDILVPQLDEFAWDNYREIPSSHSCWFYTCMYPRGNFANRYVTLPLIKTRLLHWINFRYDSPGYLHWGFNSWGANGDPYGDVSAPANDWPGGDSHIVYPGFRKLYPSIRLLAMRDGIRDYELLRMIEKTDKAKALYFAKKIIPDFDQYDTSILQFRQIRKNMLEFLSSTNQ